MKNARYIVLGCLMSLALSVQARVYVAGEKEEGGKLLTSGGRVLGVTAVAGDLKEAIKESYAMVEQVHFENAYYRHDIGQRALNA